MLRLQYQSERFQRHVWAPQKHLPLSRVFAFDRDLFRLSRDIAKLIISAKPTGIYAPPTEISLEYPIIAATRDFSGQS